MSRRLGILLGTAVVLMGGGLVVLGNAGAQDPFHRYYTQGIDDARLARVEGHQANCLYDLWRQVLVSPDGNTNYDWPAQVGTGFMEEKDYEHAENQWLVGCAHAGGNAG